MSKLDWITALGRKVGSQATEGSTKHFKSWAGYTAFAAGTGVLANHDSFGEALFKGGLEGLIFEALPGPMLGILGAQLGAALVKGGYQLYDTQYQAHRSNYINMHRTFNTPFVDTQQALTMRQAGVQAISRSKLNARSAIGGEAALMHRPYQSIY